MKHNSSRVNRRAPTRRRALILAALLGAGLAASASGQSATRINCGGGRYTDQAGNVWRADTLYSGGSKKSTRTAITGTTDPALYQNARVGGSRYRLVCAKSMVDVTFYFAEFSEQAPNRRIFDISINGQVVIRRLDIFRETGGRFRALTKTARVFAGNGALDIRFASVKGSPAIAAIEAIVIPSLDATPWQVDFGSIAVGSTSANTQISMFNIGILPVHVTGVRFVGDNPGDFRAVGFQPVTLEPSTITPVDVHFAPLATGLRTASFVIDLDNAAHYVPVQGMGTAVHQTAGIVALRADSAEATPPLTLFTSAAPGPFVVRWASEIGRTYQIECSTNLCEPWTPVGTVIGKGGTLSYPVAGDRPNVFIRVSTPGR